MSVLGARPWRPVRRAMVVGALLACLALAVLVVQATRAAGTVDDPPGTRTGTASVAGIEMVTMTRTASPAGSEASVSLRPAAALLLLLPAAGATIVALASRRPRAAP